MTDDSTLNRAQAYRQRWVEIHDELIALAEKSRSSLDLIISKSQAYRQRWAASTQKKA